MTNLQPKDKTTFVYRTAEIGEIIEVEVEYSQGVSLSHRGIWLRITPVKLEQREGYVSKSFALFSGVTIMLARLPRSTPKTLAAFAAVLDPIAPELAVLFKAQGADTVKERVKALFAPAQAVTA